MRQIQWQAPLEALTLVLTNADPTSNADLTMPFEMAKRRVGSPSPARNYTDDGSPSFPFRIPKAWALWRLVVAPYA